MLAPFHFTPTSNMHEGLVTTRITTPAVQRNPKEYEHQVAPNDLAFHWRVGGGWRMLLESPHSRVTRRAVEDGMNQLGEITQRPGARGREDLSLLLSLLLSVLWRSKSLEKREDLILPKHHHCSPLPSQLWLRASIPVLPILLAFAHARKLSLSKNPLPTFQARKPYGARLLRTTVAIHTVPDHQGRIQPQ